MEHKKKEEKENMTTTTNNNINDNNPHIVEHQYKKIKSAFYNVDKPFKSRIQNFNNYSTFY